jgi:regulator of sigma E protease
VVKFILFFFSLSLLIILHEFGHFITARWFKTRVDKFYLFFDFLFPFSNVFKFSLFKKKIGDTEYGLGWFPFGGYVDITGMMADPDDKEQKEPQPHEFRAKKPWQRLIILAGGITVNFLLAIIIYSMMMWVYGEEYLPAQNAKYGVYCDSIALRAGMMNGDKVLALDNVPVDDLHKAAFTVVVEKPKTIQVERNGQKLSLDLADELGLKFVDKEVAPFEAGYPFVIDSVTPKSPALAAKLQPGDSLFALNSDTLFFFQQFGQQLRHNKNKTVAVHFYRKGQPMQADVKLGEDGLLGVMAKSPDNYLEFKTQDYSFFAAWKRGAQLTVEKLGQYVSQMRLLFTKTGASKIGGFGSMAKIFPSDWNWRAFWSITAYLSVILAFMNLLPIPVLDGGYILFVLWEMITGKKVSDKFMNSALQIGMYIVLALLVFANGNDILRAFQK